MSLGCRICESLPKKLDQSLHMHFYRLFRMSDAIGSGKKRHGYFIMVNGKMDLSFGKLNAARVKKENFCTSPGVLYYEC